VTPQILNDGKETPSNLWVLAHPDDEILALHLALDRPNSINYVIYLTDGLRGGSTFSPESRQEEAKAAWNLISVNNSIVFFGSDNFLQDGLLAESFKQSHFKDLINLISDLNSNRIITLDFEGGHQDHDAAALIANSIAARLNLEICSFPAYRSINSFLPFYAVMKQKGKNGLFVKVNQGKKIEFAFLSLKLMTVYRSQKVTWFGLGLFVFFKYLCGRLRVIKPNKIISDEVIIPENFLYVQRKKSPLVDYEKFIKNLNDWSNHSK
jgi:hypothetical protein